MKKVLLITLMVVILTSCTSMIPNNAGYEYMTTITPVGDNGVWKVKNYVDEFGNPTDNKYIATSTIGAFSNSATNGSELIAGILANKNDVEINLLEYGTYPISVIGSSASINVKMSVNGETINVGNAIFLKGTKRLVINNALPVFKALVENPKVTMLITINDYGLSRYLFDIDSAGFEYTYHEAFIK